MQVAVYFGKLVLVVWAAQMIALVCLVWEEVMHRSR